MRTVAAVALVITFSLSPVADQCDQPTFARSNPALCGYPGPFGRLPGSGGPPDGGLIGRILHGLTGGIL